MRVALASPTPSIAPQPPAGVVGAAAASETVSAPAFTPVPVSDVPAERAEQLGAFFRRNPGWIRTGPAGDAIRGALDHVPWLGRTARLLTEPAGVGYGQAISDQTAWQATTGRQPDNPWWMRVNRQLVEDPLTAERAVRTGTVDELQTAGQRAWVEYVRRSDEVTRGMGLDPETDAVAGAEPGGQPIALSDAWRGVSRAERRQVAKELAPAARDALWTAHRATLQEAWPAALDAARAVHAVAPDEIEYGSGWLSLIDRWSHLNPPARGHQSQLAQRWLMPRGNPVTLEHEPLTVRAFAKVLDWLDTRYERDVVGASA